jgi:group I intron endonuclease
MEELDLHQYKNKYVVYMLTSPSGKQYCGYTSNLKKRWRGEKGSGYSKCPKVWKAIQKYGWNNIKKEILYVYDNAEEALKKEKEIIKIKQLITKGYNCVEGGGEPPHGLQYVSEEGYERMRANGKRLANEIWNNPKKAAYSIQRMKEVQKARAAAMSPEERKQYYGAHNIGNLPPNAKSIYQLDLETKNIIAEYPSARRAAEALGDVTYRANIARTANGKGKSAYGFAWKWKEENK